MCPVSLVSRYFTKDVARSSLIIPNIKPQTDSGSEAGMTDFKVDCISMQWPACHLKIPVIMRRTGTFPNKPETGGLIGSLSSIELKKYRIISLKLFVF